MNAMTPFYPTVMVPGRRQYIPACFVPRHTSGPGGAFEPMPKQLCDTVDSNNTSRESTITI